MMYGSFVIDFEWERTSEMWVWDSRSEMPQKWSLRAILSLGVFEGVSRLVHSCLACKIVPLFICKRFEGLKWSKNKDHVFWYWNLFLKQSWNSWFQCEVQELVGWLTGYRYVASCFEKFWSQKQQSTGSRTVDIMSKVTFPKWKWWVCAKNGKSTWTKLQTLG